MNRVRTCVSLGAHESPSAEPPGETGSMVSAISLPCAEIRRASPVGLIVTVLPSGMDTVRVAVESSED